MSKRTVQPKVDECPESEGNTVRRWKDGRFIRPGELDMSTEGIVRGCELVTQIALRAKREGWPGW